MKFLLSGEPWWKGQCCIRVLTDLKNRENSDLNRAFRWFSEDGASRLGKKEGVEQALDFRIG